MLLQRILDVVMFLGERGLAFRGDSEKIGDTHNGNFLGIVELLARYDPLLQEHVGKVKSAQEKELDSRLTISHQNLKMSL